MKTLILLLFLATAPQTSFEKVDQLVKDRQYSDAFRMLDDMDPDNQDPAAVRRKIDIAVDYYILSISHQIFALKNLEADENIEELRGQEGTYDLFDLDVASIAAPLMEKHPDDYLLKFAVGKYYHSMHLNCGNCSLSPTDCIGEFETLFEEAYQHGVYDYMSVYAIGYAKIYNQGYGECIPYFQKSIELNDDYPFSHYNLSYAYMYMDKYKEAANYAQNAYDRYDYAPYKADAARIAGTAYRELEDYENAYRYFKMAQALSPDDYYTLLPLLNLSMQLKKEDAENIRDAFFQLDTDNATIYTELIYAYYDYGNIAELLAYFESLLPQYENDLATQANLYFFIGKLDLENGQTERGKEMLHQAKTLFLKVFPEDHQVFSVIEELLK